MRKTKGFSYDPAKDKDVMEHIRRNGGSQYVWELVRKDMKANSIEDLIRRQIEKYLQGMNRLAGKEKIVMDIDETDIKNILDL